MPNDVEPSSVIDETSGIDVLKPNEYPKTPYQYQREDRSVTDNQWDSPPISLTPDSPDDGSSDSD